MGLALLLGSVQGAQEPIAASATPHTVLAGEWQEVSAAAGQHPLTLTLDGRSRLSASVGCNDLSGRYAARGDVLLTSSLASTRMACDPQTSAAEAGALARLRGLTRYTLAGDLLTLSGAAGDLTLRRSGPALGLKPTSTAQEEIMPSNPVPEASSLLAGGLIGQWQVRSLELAGQSPMTLLPEATLEFSPAEAPTETGVRLAGTLGCNQFSAPLTPPASGQGSDEWEVGALAMTRMGCPPQQAQAEAALAEVLRQPITLSRTAGDTLTLTSAAGKLVLQVAHPAAPAATAWAEAYQGSLLRLEGQDVPLSPPATFQVQPQADGTLRLSGNVGCNHIHLTAAPAEAGWSLAPAAVTRMACKDMSAEQQVLKLLGQPATLWHEGEALVFRSVLGELQLTPVAAQPAEPATPEAAAPESANLRGTFTLSELRKGG